MKAATIDKAAETYALKRGWHVFPGKIVGKTKKSYKSGKDSNGARWGATNDVAEIRRDFQRWPKALIGIPTGEHNGFFVLETDTKKGHGVDGIAGLKQLEKKHGRLPETLMAASPSNSVHRYFKYPPDVEIRNSASEIAPGVDIRGEGGMVIAPPSQRKDGAYRWLNDKPIAGAPKWLIELVKNKRDNDAPRISTNMYPPATLAEVAAALAVIPSDNEKIWFKIGYVLYKVFGEDGFPLFEEWSKKSPKYDRRLCAKKYSDFAKYDYPYTVGTIFHYANEASPGWREALRPKSEPFALILQPHSFPNERTIPQWEFLYGRHLLRRTVSGTAAMGATGKTSMSLVEALAMASGKPLLGEEVPKQPLRVLLICLEDNRNAMDKRIAAAMKLHKLTPQDIGGRLFIKAKGEIKFKIARLVRGSVLPNTELIEQTINFLRDNKIDVFSIDPFVKTHGVPENDNNSISEVIDCYDEIAERANGAVALWHHTRKGGGGPVTVESSRGAQAFIDACRSVRILETMTDDEAKKQKIEQHRRYFRAFSGKLNFAPPTDKSAWYQLTSVPILNGPLAYFAIDGGNGGDNVGVVEAWELPSSSEVDLTPEHRTAIEVAIRQSDWRENTQSGMWVGKAIAPILGLDPEDDKPKLKKLVKKLISDRVLKVIPGKTTTRKPCLFVVNAD
jgi:hypothetical protein